MDLFPFPQNYTLIVAELFSLILFLLYCFISLKPKTTKNRVRVAAPEARGGWPIIGHFNLFRGSSQLPHKALGSMADKYGPIFMVRLGMHRALVVSSSEISKEIFTTHDLAVSSRPKNVAAKHLTHNYAMFGFTQYGPYWREIRKIVSLNLLSSRRLDLLKHVRASELQTSIKELYKLSTEKKDGNGGQVLVEMKQWFGNLNLNVVLQMVAGKRFSCGSTHDPKEEKEVRHCRKVMREFFHLMGVFVVEDILPFLGWLDLGGHEKAMKKTAKEMNSIVQIWLDEHRRKRDSDEATGDQDFMDVMLSTLEESGGLGGFPVDTVIKATCLDLIASSSDTTTSMLTWVLSMLLNNPDVLKKAQEEMDLHIGKDKEVNESDVHNLVYLQAIIKETFRLYPVAPLGGRREFSEDCTVAGYHVPKGTRLLVNMWKLHRDPQTWSEPSRFMLERFLGSQKHYDFKGQDFELIPFGAGRRYCAGMTFGLQILHLVTATLQHNFELSTPANAPVDMTESVGLTNSKGTPLQVLLTPRLSPNMN